MTIVACIPAYNEEETIGSVILRSQQYVDHVIVCDDGSSDRTAEISVKLGALVIHHKENMGYGAALRSLFKAARDIDADVAVTLDADGQHNPEEIPTLAKPALEGTADAVIGSRFIYGGYIPFYRKLGVKIITRLLNVVCRQDITDTQSGFRAYNRKAIELLLPQETGMGAGVEILMKASEERLRVVEIPARITYQGKTSTHNPISHGAKVVMTIVRRKAKRMPSYLASLVGSR